MLPVDMVDDIADDIDIDSGVILERDIRVDHDDFNLVDNSRIADVITYHRGGQLMPAIEPETKPRKKALFTGIGIFGAVGSGKATCCMYPFAQQLLAYSRDDPDRRIGGLILEVKGDFCYRVREVTLFDVYECAINPDRLAQRIAEGQALFEPGEFLLVDPHDYYNAPDLKAFAFDRDPALAP